MAEVAVQKKETFWDQIQQMEDRVLRRAYDISRGNGTVFGQDLDNWLTAERELIWKPAIELKQKGNQYEVQVAVAGIDPKDIKIEATAEGLLIKGKMKTEKKEEKGETIVSEFQAGSLFRSIQFPKTVDPDRVKAEIKNGLLTVIVPIAEQAKARKVDIHAA